MRVLIFTITLVLISNISIAQGVTADLSYYPKTEFNAEVVQKYTSKTGNTFKKIVIDGFDSKIPFYFIQPKNNDNNRFVILLHGLGGSKDNWVYPMSDLSKKYTMLKDSLLSLGYSVVIPDAKYHGERSYEANFAPPQVLFTPSNSQKISNMWVTTVKDIRIIMDYMELVSQEKSITFNVIGYSMGGMIAILLNSVDNRLKSVVACVPPLDGPKALKNVFGWKDLETAEKLDHISPQNYAKMQKAPIYLLMGKKDVYYTEKNVKDFLNEISVKEKKMKFYESGHLLPMSFITDAIKCIN